MAKRSIETMGMAQIPKTTKAVESPGTQPLRFFWRFQAASAGCTLATAAGALGVAAFFS